VATTYVQLNGYSDRQAHEVAWDAKEAVGLAGGWVLEANLLSNKSLVIVFEMHARDLGELVGRLERVQVALDEGSRQKAEAVAAAHQGQDEAARGGEVAGTLQITLGAGGPDVRRVVPSVPG
jgi:hypothetical protein